jgi:hypothetical protein
MKAKLDEPACNKLSESAEAEEIKSPVGRKLKAPATRESGKKLARLGGPSTGLADFGDL